MKNAKPGVKSKVEKSGKKPLPNDLNDQKEKTQTFVNVDD